MTKDINETTLQSFASRIQACYLHGVWDFLDENALDYSYAIAFNKKINFSSIISHFFKPTKAELWSDNAQKRVLFQFEPMEDAAHTIKALTLYVSAVAPAMLILTTVTDYNNIPLRNVENLELYEENAEHADPWKALTKELVTIAKSLNIERCTIKEHVKCTVPFVSYYDWYGDNDDDTADEEALVFLDKELKDLSPDDIKLAKSYPPQPTDLIDCLFARGYGYI